MSFFSGSINIRSISPNPHIDRDSLARILGKTGMKRILRSQLGADRDSFVQRLSKKRVLDLLAFAGILHSYWGIDVAAFAPGLLEGIWPWHFGWYWLLMYVQGILGAFWLFIRTLGAKK